MCLGCVVYEKKCTVANTVEGLAEVYKDHSRQWLLVYSPEGMISNQKAKEFL